MTDANTVPEEGTPNGELLFQVTAPHFCAGLVARDDKCVEAAPILKYMRAWSRERIEVYCRRKGWQIERVNL